jgi:hypothetical protein
MVQQQSRADEPCACEAYISVAAAWIGLRASKLPRPCSQQVPANARPRRPDEHEHRELFEATLAGVDVSSELIDEWVAITGPRDGRPSFTFSDIQTVSCQRRSREPIPTGR